MTKTFLRTVAAAALLLMAAGCSATSSSTKSPSQDTPPAPAPSGQTEAAPSAAVPAGDAAQLHNHGADVSKLGLNKGVVDNIMEGTDIAQLSPDGQGLVAVDLFNTLDLLHGSLMVIKDQVMIYLNGKSVVWSEQVSDLPADANLVAPVTWDGNRLRMSADLLAKTMQLAGLKDSKMEVKDHTLFITTGR